MSPDSIANRQWFVPGILLFLTLAVYANSFPGIFVQDDWHIVVNNPLVAELHLPELLRGEYWQGIESNGLYRPLTIFSFYLNRLLTGPGATGFHLVNVLLHALCAVFLWRLLLTWQLAPLAAFAAAALFAVHPIHGEAVNVVVGRSELFAALFILLALIAASHERPAVWPCALWYLAALLSKEHAVCLLLLLPLRDLYLAGSLRALRGRVALYAVLGALTALWLLWRQFGVTRILPASAAAPEVLPLAQLEAVDRMVNALLLQGLYVIKLMVPYQLQASYAASDLPATLNAFSLPGLLVVLAAGAVLAALLSAWRRRTIFALFAALYLGSFLLTANLLFPIGVTFAERLAYLPSLWFCAGLAMLMPQSLARWPARAGLAALLCFLLMLSGLAMLRHRDYVSELRYWQVDFERNPADHLALVNYAEIVAEGGAFGEADAAYRVLQSQAPTFAYGHRSRSNFLFNQGRVTEARAATARALELARLHGDRAAAGHDLAELARIDLTLGALTSARASLEESAVLLGEQNIDQQLRHRLEEALRNAAGDGGRMESPR